MEEHIHKWIDKNLQIDNYPPYGNLAGITDNFIAYHIALLFGIENQEKVRQIVDEYLSNNKPYASCFVSTDSTGIRCGFGKLRGEKISRVDKFHFSGCKELRGYGIRFGAQKEASKFDTLGLIKNYV